MSEGIQRQLGRFQLLRLAAKSERSMLWIVQDPQQADEVLLALPRHQPADEAARARWHEHAQRVRKLQHPGLVVPFEIGEAERWPYLAYTLGRDALLTERLAGQALPPVEWAGAVARSLQGLATAHDDGIVHGDLHAAMFLVPVDGRRDAGGILGLGVVPPAVAAMPSLAQHRAQAIRDDLAAVGLVMHQTLAGTPALGDDDVMHAMGRMAPTGDLEVRLASGVAAPEALRVIVDRATDPRAERRYHHARTMQLALLGWLQSLQEAGPLGVLTPQQVDGALLPITPRGMRAAASLARGLAGQRTHEMAQEILQDTGLAIEVMRRAERMAAAAAFGAGNGPVIAIRRCLAIGGTDLIERAAQSMRPWPARLEPEAAQALSDVLEQLQLAARLAQAIAPAGFDGEVVAMLVMLQRLGWLALHAHRPQQAAQVRMLMRSPTPGVTPFQERRAVLAVLGIDVDELTMALGRAWRLDDGLRAMMRRQVAEGHVGRSTSDAETLRLVASAGLDTMQALALEGRPRAQALGRVVQRYGEALALSADALKAAIGTAIAGTSAAPPAAAQPAPAAPRARPAAEPAQRSPTT